MAITKETISGTKIINEIKSSNIKKSKLMICEFNNGLKYEYKDIPHAVYTKFRMSESQGKFFTTDISKKYQYKKL